MSCAGEKRGVTGEGLHGVRRREGADRVPHLALQVPGMRTGRTGPTPHRPPEAAQAQVRGRAQAQGQAQGQGRAWALACAVRAVRRVGALGLSAMRAMLTQRARVMALCARAGCGREFTPAPSNASRQRYCSPACRQDDYNGQYLSSGSRRGLTTGTTGAIGELAAGADLLRRGYEVFRALSPSCSCDLVAVRDGQILRIEVRTGNRNSRTGHVSYKVTVNDTADP
jgi:hypothetical protein